MPVPRPARALVLTAALALAACQMAARPAPLATAVTPTPLTGEIDAYLASRNPSGAFLFAVGDKVIFKKGYGVLTEGGAPIAADVLFPIGSVTKQFTAAAVLHLAERRKLSLDDRLSRFFPEVPEDKAGITVQQLLGHNSGLARNVGDVYELIEPEEFRKRVFAAKLDFAPGAHHRYSNSGYILLGQIIEKVSGMPLADYFDRHLIRPAGMVSTGYPGPRFEGVPIPRGYDRPKFGETYSATPMTEPGGQDPRYRDGAGGLLSTVSDLLRWERALMGGRILSKAWLEQMLTPHGLVTADGKFKYGYAWVIQDSKSGPMFWHNGVWYSYYTEVRVFPQAGVIAIGFTNRQQDETFDETFGTALRKLLESTRAAPAGGA